MAPCKIILGIGNPGVQYEETRHNFGFQVVDTVARTMGVSNKKIRFQALITETQLVATKILLVKPLTYVNQSGVCARAICEWYDLPPESLLVAVDDISLPLGQIRIRRQGSSGSHRGLESIISSLKTQAFPRLRLGIRGDYTGELVSYVLSKFTSEESRIVHEILPIAGAAVMTWVEEGIESAMNKYNCRNQSVDPA